jgi:hypothetical protein
VYTGTGPAFVRETGPGGRSYERLGRLGDELELPIGHAQVLRDAGYVAGASEADEQAIVAASQPGAA